MRKPSPAMIVALVALFVALSGVGVAANGGSFILGHSNSATLNTVLSAPVAGGKALQVTNNNTSNAASTALGLNVAAGHAPFTVNSGVKVANLNADTLDGVDSSALIQGKGKVYTLAVSIPRLITSKGYNTYTPSPAVAPGFVNFSFDCPDLGGAFSSEIRADNLSGGPTNIFGKALSKAYGPGYVARTAGGSAWFYTTNAGDISTLTIEGRPPSTGLLTITTATISTVVRSSDCHFQVQALTTYS